MIDINCDLGEGLGNEDLLMPLISSCNIACGGHAGSVKIIDRVLQLAVENKVKIGAHPGFPDKENFGRVVMDISNAKLQQTIEEQLQLFKERATLQNATIHHIKPHGALYNLIAVDEEKATIVVKAVQNIFENIQLYAPFNSKIEKVAQKNGINIVYEVFIDRTYNDDLTLTSRSLPYALITDKVKAVNHVQKMIEESLVRTIQGNEQPIKAQTFCIHGDNEQAVEILKELNEKFMPV